MTIFGKLMALRNALNYGEELSNKEAWKTVGVVVSLQGLLLAILQLFPNAGGVDDALINKLANGIYAAVLLFNAYLHPATSKSIGFGKEKSGNAE